MASLAATASLVLTPGAGHAEGTQTLGAINIPLPGGTSVITDGVGLVNQPANVTLSVPQGADVRKVLLYWQGLHYGAPDKTIKVNGTEVRGDIVGGPTAFVPGAGAVQATTVRADITQLAGLQTGNNVLTLSGVAFDDMNDGAAVVAILDDGTPKAQIFMHDGVDTAWNNFQDPLLNSTVPRTFNFAPSISKRVARLTVNAGDVGVNRPNIVRVKIPGQPTQSFVNKLHDTDGASWDTVTFDVNIPAEASALTAELQPFDDGSGNPAASLALVNMTLVVPNGLCPDPRPAAAADGNAFGVFADIRNKTVHVPARPHTDGANPDYVASVNVDNIVTDTLVFVQNDKFVGNANASDTAEAVVNGLNVNLAPHLTLSADSVVARSTSTADGAGAGSTADGSLVQNLVVNGKSYPEAASGAKLIIPVMSGTTKIGDVFVLQTAGSHAAGGVAQPESDGSNKSGLEVNALRIRLYDLTATSQNETTDIIVAHADSFASAPSQVGCALAPAVAGEAFVLGASTTPNLIDGARLGRVSLPSTGGHEQAEVASLQGFGTGAGFSETEGNTGEPAVRSLARVAKAELLPYAENEYRIKALLVEARASDPDGAEHGTTIADLHIMGYDICAELDFLIGSTCTPAKNTTVFLPSASAPLVKLVLNEQFENATGRTVNAVHLTVLHPEFKQAPVGTDIIISSARADKSL